MSNIPCTEIKCISLPICKTKEMLYCGTLFTYALGLIDRRPIAKFMPNLIWLFSNDGYRMKFLQGKKDLPTTETMLISIGEEYLIS